MLSKIQTFALSGSRFFLAAIFLLSGIGKLIDREDAIFLVELLATKFFVLIEYSDGIIISLSIAELILAALLIRGKNLTTVFLISAAFISVFIFLLGYFYLQGFAVASCGCFGAFGISGGLEATLIRNIVLMAVCAVGIFYSMRKSTPNPGLSES